MEQIELSPRLLLLRFPVGNAYLWHERDALTLIDTGVAGSGKDIEGAIRSLGRTLADLRHVIVTHGHDDHHGALAEIAAGAAVMAHRADAPVVRGEARSNCRTGRTCPSGSARSTTACRRCRPSPRRGWIGSWKAAR